MTIKIAIGADHRGFECKEYIMNVVENVDWIDVGAHNDTRSDFPDFTKSVCELILKRTARYGVLICGSGVGMAIAANRFKKIHAALVWNDEVALSSKEHNHANVLVLPADYITKDDAVRMIKIWLAGEPMNGRYQERINMIDRF